MYVCRYVCMHACMHAPVCGCQEASYVAITLSACSPSNLSLGQLRQTPQISQTPNVKLESSRAQRGFWHLMRQNWQPKAKQDVNAKNVEAQEQCNKQTELVAAPKENTELLLSKKEFKSPKNKRPTEAKSCHGPRGRLRIPYTFIRRCPRTGAEPAMVF